MSTAQTLRTGGIFSIYGEKPVYRDNFFVRKTRSITRLGLGVIDRREPDGAVVWSASASLERRRHANPLSPFEARNSAPQSDVMTMREAARSSNISLMLGGCDYLHGLCEYSLRIEPRYEGFCADAVGRSAGRDAYGAIGTKVGSRRHGYHKHQCDSDPSSPSHTSLPRPHQQRGSRA